MITANHLRQLSSALSSAHVVLLRLYIANMMDPDQTATKVAVRSGFIVFASMVKVVWSTFENMQHDGTGR